MTFFKVFFVVELILNAISIALTGVEHWVGSYTEMLQGYISFVFAITSGLFTETKVDWSYFFESMFHFGMAFQIQILAIIISGVLIYLSESDNFIGSHRYWRTHFEEFFFYISGKWRKRKIYTRNDINLKLIKMITYLMDVALVN